MNAIAARIADFLRDYKPFSSLEAAELLEVALSVHVVNIEKGKTLFKSNDLLHDSFYVVFTGLIALSVITDAEETLLNKAAVGDVFGLRPFFAQNNYFMSAKAREESVLLAIPVEKFRTYVAKHTSILNYLLESFVANGNGTDDIEIRNQGSFDKASYKSMQPDIQYFQSLSYNKTPIIASVATLSKDIAQAMTDNLTDNVLITSNNLPVGIITDSDMRSKIATGRFPISIAAEKIMSSPVITVTENISIAEAQLVMLRHNVSHLCVTIDGSENSAIRGIISEHDLVVAQASNPGVLVKEIKKSQSWEDLKKVRQKLTEIIQASFNKNTPVAHIMNIAGEINMAMIKRAVDLAILEFGSPPARFAWLSLGSQGRKEQLLLTDQDSILIFEDVAPEKYASVKEYFLKLASKIISILVQVGYESSDDNRTAANIQWCKSLSEWLLQYQKWMTNPGEKANNISSTFFDYEIVVGEPKLEEALTSKVFELANKNKLFFDYLGNDAIRKPPPLSFFKKFNLEEDGIFKDKFDIKKRAIMPLVDSARLFTLSHDIRGINNTFLRFKQLAMVDPKNAEIFNDAADAFQLLSKFRTLEGLKNNTNGQFVDLEEISKTDKEKLKNALQPMRDLEELIKDSFQLTKFS